MFYYLVMHFINFTNVLQITEKLGSKVPVVTHRPDGIIGRVPCFGECEFDEVYLFSILLFE